MTLLRRFALIGTIATLLDVVVLVVLAGPLGWSVWLADVVAVGLATAVSWTLHTLVTPEGDPGRGWFRRAGTYWSTAALALVADVGVLSVLDLWLQPGHWWGLLLLKVCSLAGAFGVRMVSYRDSMFAEVRGVQAQPAGRPPSPGALRLSVVVPAYREEDRVEGTVQRIRAALSEPVGADGLEIVVVDDGSDDATAARAEAAGADQVIRCETNRGKGAAVRTGMLAARGRTIAFTDADLSYAPEQVLALLDGVERGWDVVVGSRQHIDTRTVVRAGRLREVGGRAINLLTGLVLLGRYRDTQCGLKAMRSDVARVIFEHSSIDGFAFDVEVFHLVERYRFSMLEVPVEVVNSSRSTVHVVRDASRLVRDLFRIRRSSRLGRYEVDPGELPLSSDGPS